MLWTQCYLPLICIKYIHLDWRMYYVAIENLVYRFRDVRFPNVTKHRIITNASHPTDANFLRNDSREPKLRLLLSGFHKTNMCVFSLYDTWSSWTLFSTLFYHPHLPSRNLLQHVPSSKSQDISKSKRHIWPACVNRGRLREIAKRQKLLRFKRNRKLWRATISDVLKRSLNIEDILKNRLNNFLLS